MVAAVEILPDDIDALKALVIQERRETSCLQEQLDQRTAHIDYLKEQLSLLLSKRFAASSEKTPADQLALFDEAEQTAAEITETESASDDITVPAHTRKKSGRKPLPDYLSRVEIIHDVADRQCPCGCGEMARIGEDISEQLDIIPAKVQVLRHIRPKYACSACKQGGIKQARLPPQPIPKSLASPGLLAHVVTAKYVDALPLHRMESILSRAGIDVQRATLANWVIRAGQLVQPLINLLRDQLLAYDVLQMDETPVQVLNEPARKAQSKSYLWVQRGGPPAQPVVLFDYDPSRGRAVPLRLLEGFSGYLQTDGYSGYNAVVENNGLVHVGCMAHARRRFDEAVRAQGKKPHGSAQQGLNYIRKLYRIEKQAQKLTAEKRHQHRLRHAQPILEKMRHWLDEVLPRVLPKSAAGKALHYLDGEWEKLIRYLDDGRLAIDNNLAENAIRPFVIGRKNWLFSDSVRGVKASANLYSLIETCKANGLEPYAYLRYLFTELPKADTVDAIEALLPGNIDGKQFSIY